MCHRPRIQLDRAQSLLRLLLSTSQRPTLLRLHFSARWLWLRVSSGRLRLCLPVRLGQAGFGRGWALRLMLALLLRRLGKGLCGRLLGAAGL